MEVVEDRVYLWHQEPHRCYPKAPSHLPFQLAQELSKYGHPVPHFHVILSFLELLTVVWQSRNLPAHVAHPRIDTSLAHLYSMDLGELERLQNVASASLIPMAYAIREGVVGTSSGMSRSRQVFRQMLQGLILSVAGDSLSHCSEEPWPLSHLRDLDAETYPGTSSVLPRLLPQTYNSSETSTGTIDSKLLPNKTEEDDLPVSGGSSRHPQKRRSSTCTQNKKPCPYCGKIYQVAGHFQNHLRIHRESRPWPEVLKHPHPVEGRFTPISTTQWAPGPPNAGTSTRTLDSLLPCQAPSISNHLSHFQVPGVQNDFQHSPSGQSDSRDAGMSKETSSNAFLSNHYTPGYSGPDVDEGLPPMTPDGNGTKRRRISGHYAVDSASPVCSVDDSLLLAFHQNVAF